MNFAAIKVAAYFGENLCLTVMYPPIDIGQFSLRTLCRLILSYRGICVRFYLFLTVQQLTTHKIQAVTFWPDSCSWAARQANWIWDRRMFGCCVRFSSK